MIKFFKKIVIFFLKLEARLTLWRFKPEIIAITGSVGKTSAKETIFTVLNSHYSARKSIKSYNSEIGVLLTILNLETAGKSYLGWLKNIFGGLKTFLAASYAKILILEFGVDRPGDMERLLNIAKPKIAVITAIDEIPVHVEFFAEPEELAEEKSKLVKALLSSGCAILNSDDPIVMDFKQLTKAKIITYGFDENADIRASNYRLMQKEELPEGISFKVDYSGANVPIRIFNSFGKSQVYAALSAVAIGLLKGLNLIEIAEALTLYQAPPGRLKLIPGIKNTLIIDDSYNSSPLATHEALDLLKELPAKRKIAVLGDMLELGKYSIQSHQTVGAKVKAGSDLLFTFGERAKFIAERARSLGFDKNKIFSFEHLDFQNLIKELKSVLEAGDLILIKGSQAMRMEKIVKEIMLEYQRVKELLVRQDWPD